MGNSNQFSKDYKSAKASRSVSKPKDTIYDPMGQWKYPGQVTKIPSGNITMQGVPYPVYGVDNLGNSQMMLPNMDYTFPGNTVTEYPMAMYGGDPSLPNITGHYPFGGRFTKTHTHMAEGGWLNKHDVGGELTEDEDVDVGYITKDQYQQKILNNYKNYLSSVNYTTPYTEVTKQGMNCIHGVCQVVQGVGAKKFMQNYTGNQTFNDNREKEGYYEAMPGLEGFEIGDILQYARTKDNSFSRFPGKVTPANAKELVPDHAEVILDKYIDDLGETRYIIGHNRGEDKFVFAKDDDGLDISESELLDRYYDGYNTYDSLIVNRYDPEEVNKQQKERKETLDRIQGKNEFAKQYVKPGIAELRNANPAAHDLFNFYKKNYKKLGNTADMPPNVLDKIFHNQVGIAKKETNFGEQGSMKDFVPDALLDEARKVSDIWRDSDDWVTDYWNKNANDVKSKYSSKDEFIKHLRQNSSLTPAYRDYIRYNSPRSKGVFQQKDLSKRGKIFNSNFDTPENQFMSSMYLAIDNYHTLKKKYPNLTEDELVDLTTLMHNAPTKALTREYVDYYLKNNDINYVNDVKNLRGNVVTNNDLLNSKLKRSSDTDKYISSDEKKAIIDYINKTPSKKFGGSSGWLDKYQTGNEVKKDSYWIDLPLNIRVANIFDKDFWKDEYYRTLHGSIFRDGVRSPWELESTEQVVKKLKDKDYQKKNNWFSKKIFRYQEGGSIGWLDKYQIRGEVQTMPASSTSTTVPQIVASKNFVFKRDQDLTKLGDTEFKEKYGTNKHTVKMNTNPSYRAKVMKDAKETAKQYGSIDYPVEDVRSQNYIGNPNLAFMNPNAATGELARGIEDYNLGVIGAALPIPGLQQVGKLPSITSAVSTGVKDLGKHLTTQTPLKNVYNILPEGTFKGYSKLRNPNKSYRVAGMDAYDDFVESGVLRSKTPQSLPGMSFAEKMQQRPTAFPSFQKGYADLNYLPDEGGVVFETSLPTFKRGQINPVTGFPIKGRHYAHRVIDPQTGAAMSSIPGENISVYGSQPHWLKGYPQLNTPKQLPGSSASSVRSFFNDATNFLLQNSNNPLSKTSIDRVSTGLKSHLYGIDQGIGEMLIAPLFRKNTRSFKEIFPLSRSAKEAAKQESKLANLEAEKFVRDWTYDKQGIIHPEIKKKIDDIIRGNYVGNTINNYTKLENKINPLFTTPNKIVNTRYKNIINNPALSEEEKIRILSNRGSALGVNYSYELPVSYTFENKGLYNLPYSDKLYTAIHEGGHTMQNLGNNIVSFGEVLAEYSPKYKYYVPNIYTPLGREFAEVMPIPRVNRSNWLTSPKELHSELMPARKKLVDKYVKSGMDYEEALKTVRNASDDDLDWMIKKQKLNRFFRKGVSQEKKREMLRILPAAAPYVGGAGIGTYLYNQQPQQKYGGWLDKYQGGGSYVGPDGKVYLNPNSYLPNTLAGRPSKEEFIANPVKYQTFYDGDVPTSTRYVDSMPTPPPTPVVQETKPVEVKVIRKDPTKKVVTEPENKVKQTKVESTSVNKPVVTTPKKVVVSKTPTTTSTVTEPASKLNFKPTGLAKELYNFGKNKVAVDNKPANEIVKNAANIVGIDPNILFASAWQEGFNKAAQKPLTRSNAYFNHQLELSRDPNLSDEEFEDKVLNLENNYPIDGFYYHGLDTFGTMYPMLEKYLPKGFANKFYSFDSKNEKGENITTAAFKSHEDALIAKAAYLRYEQDNVKNHAKKLGIDLNPNALKYFTFASYNSGFTNARKMLNEYARAFDKQSFIKKGSPNWQRVHKNVYPRMQNYEVAQQIKKFGGSNWLSKYE